MKRPIVLFLCLAGAAAGALPDGFQPMAGEDACVRFAISNDAMGPGPVDEWDDLQTYGFGLTVAVMDPLALATEYQSFTWRSDSPSTASRIDVLSFCLAAGPFDASVRGMRLGFRGSLGARVFGNLGGAVLQEGFHRTVGIDRPIPAVYDAYSSPAFTASLSAEAAAAHGAVRPAVFASIGGDLPGSWRLQAGARTDIGSPGSGLTAWALYRWRPPSGLAAALDAVSRSTTGTVVGLELGASCLTSFMEFNLSEGVSNGAIGLRIGVRRSGDAVHGIPITLELHNDFVRCVTGYRVLFPLLGPGVRVCAGAALGWWNPTESSDTGLRSSQYSTGVEGRLTVPLGRWEAQVACALQPVATVVTLHPLGMERSHVQDRSILLAVRIEPAVRIGFVEKMPGGGIHKTGLGVALAVEPPAKVLVPFRFRPAVSNRPLTLRVFVYGEVPGDPHGRARDRGRQDVVSPSE